MLPFAATVHCRLLPAVLAIVKRLEGGSADVKAWAADMRRSCAVAAAACLALVHACLHTVYTSVLVTPPSAGPDATPPSFDWEMVRSRGSARANAAVAAAHLSDLVVQLQSFNAPAALPRAAVGASTLRTMMGDGRSDSLPAAFQRLIEGLLCEPLTAAAVLRDVAAAFPATFPPADLTPAAVATLAAVAAAPAGTLAAASTSASPPSVSAAGAPAPTVPVTPVQQILELLPGITSAEAAAALALAGGDVAVTIDRLLAGGGSSGGAGAGGAGVGGDGADDPAVSAGGGPPAPAVARLPSHTTSQLRYGRRGLDLDDMDAEVRQRTRELVALQLAQGDTSDGDDAVDPPYAASERGRPAPLARASSADDVDLGIGGMEAYLDREFGAAAVVDGELEYDDDADDAYDVMDHDPTLTAGAGGDGADDTADHGAAWSVRGGRGGVAGGRGGGRGAGAAPPPPPVASGGGRGRGHGRGASAGAGGGGGGGGGAGGPSAAPALTAAQLQRRRARKEKAGNAYRGGRGAGAGGRGGAHARSGTATYTGMG